MTQTTETDEVFFL